MPPRWQTDPLAPHTFSLEIKPWMILEGAEGRLKSKAKHGAFLWRRYCVKREQRALSLQQRKEPSRGSCRRKPSLSWRWDMESSAPSPCVLLAVRPVPSSAPAPCVPPSGASSVPTGWSGAEGQGGASHLYQNAYKIFGNHPLVHYIQAVLTLPGIALKAVTCQGQRKDFSHPPSDYLWPLTLLRVRSIAVRLSTASWVSDQDIW